MEIGEKVKDLRQKSKTTLKELSEKTEISTGFLSQFERGLTTIDVEHLKKIAEIFNVKISYFFDDEENKDFVIRSYDQKIVKKMNRTIYKQLSPDPNNLAMKPELIELLPKENREIPAPYTHEGEEFVYVLSGILTLVIGGKTYKMFPGDSTHFSSLEEHNWGNETSESVRIIVVHYTKNDSYLDHV